MKDKKMERTLINQIENHAGEEVKISGFVQTIRNQGKIKFLIIRDVSGTIQTVASDLPKEEMDLIDNLSMESVVEITGTAKKEAQAPGGIEITIQKISILSQAETPLPIPVVNKAGEEVELQKRLDWKWLDLRKPSNALIFKVWTLMEQSFREYLIAKDFIEIHSPKLMSSPSETGAELFEVKYFDRKAYLAQSPQFYKQMAMASGFEKVFEVGPVFRADPSFTSRHATEFTGYDIEFSYVDSHQDVMDLEQNLIHHIVEKIKEKYGEEIKKYFNRDLIIPEIPFPQ
jgi:aspartyl-tRNA synthetase